MFQDSPLMGHTIPRKLFFNFSDFNQSRKYLRIRGSCHPIHNPKLLKGHLNSREVCQLQDIDTDLYIDSTQKKTSDVQCSSYFLCISLLWLQVLLFQIATDKYQYQVQILITGLHMYL